MRLFLMVITIVFSAPSVFAQQETRLQKITKLFDLNESAIAYHKHCVTNTALPSARFMNNVKVITAALNGELAKAYPDKSAEEIEAEILRRGMFVQRKYDKYFSYTDCEAGGGVQAARKHYLMFQRLDDQEVYIFINKL